MHEDRVGIGVRWIDRRRHLARPIALAALAVLGGLGGLVLASSTAVLGTVTAHAAVAPAHDGGLHAPPRAAGDGRPDDTEPLTAADRDLLAKVRLAGLWEMPAGRMAAQKAVSPRVREIGEMISSQHNQLDVLVAQTAARLGVALPQQPNDDQQGWLDELRAATGTQFDHVFVDRLRAAHGKIFPAIAAVRAGTRNALVRQFAQSANGFVLTHLTLLESTGLVDYTGLPLPAQPSLTGHGPSITDLERLLGWVRRTQPWVGILLVPITVLVIVPRLVRRLTQRRRVIGSRGIPRQGPAPARYDHRPSSDDGTFPTRSNRSAPVSAPVRRLRANPPVRH